jgi:hypothetical protein
LWGGNFFCIWIKESNKIIPFLESTPSSNE